MTNCTIFVESDGTAWVVGHISGGDIFGGGGGGTTETRTVQELSPEQQRLLSFVIPGAEEFARNPPTLFPGTQIAPINPLQITAQQNALELAGVTGPGTSVTNPEIARIQALIASTAPTITTPSTGVDTGSQLVDLRSQVSALEQRRSQERGIFETTGEGIPFDFSGQQQLDQLLAQITGFEGQPTFTPGTTTANPRIAELQALLAGLPPTVGGPPTVGEGPLSAFADTATSFSDFLLGPVLFPESNPALRAATDAAIRPLIEQFQNPGGALSSIRQEAITAGGFGGSRQGIAEGLAAQGLQRQIGDTTAKIQADAFQQSLDAATRALFLAPQTQQLPFTQVATIEAVGLQRRQEEQARLTEQVQRSLSEQLLPFAALQQVAALAFGIPAGSVTSTSTFSGGGGGGLSDILGVLGIAASLAAPFLGPAAAAGAGGSLAARSLVQF